MSVDGDDVGPDLAMELELRDELLVACRQLLLGIGTREAAVLVAHMDALSVPQSPGLAGYPRPAIVLAYRQKLRNREATVRA